jgi:hypothetical protein
MTVTTTLLIIAVGVALLLWRSFFPAYVGEKGKNLATKEDIAEITRKVEEVKLVFAEYQVRSSRVFEKQLEAVHGTYERLHDADEFVKHMVHPVQLGGDEEEHNRRTEAAAKFNDLSGFYWKHKLYLPEDLCEQVEALLHVMKRAFNEYVVARDGRGDDGSLDRWNSAYRAMQDEVPALRSALEQRFRALLTFGFPG